MTDLRARITEAIRLNGPMPVSLYMLMCLHDPRDGYYATRPGFNQDFTTAPETSQVFGELVGLWAAHEWMRLGSPEKFWLIELGPGRGTMMADLLRAAHSVPGFASAAQVALVEASPALRDQQKHLLSKFTVQHFEELDDVPDGPTIIVANEFLDCLAIRQYVRDGNGWRERQVGLDNAGNLAIGIGPPAELPEDVIPVGDHVEVAPALETVISGRALFIDYGPDDRSPDETLRAYKAGEQVDPLSAPGVSDLTADVDFPRMRRICESEGVAVHGPIQQRYFLTRLGAKERAEQLIAANPRRAEEIARAVDKLVSPDQMGSRFKAIALTPFGAETPPGF
jgi:NADH dehydrogenase [ubiquinone] 1 alpha subcomplex assembly factor 7